jgi:hypothetical protein
MRSKGSGTLKRRPVGAGLVKSLEPSLPKVAVITVLYAPDKPGRFIRYAAARYMLHGISVLPWSKQFRPTTW